MPRWFNGGTQPLVLNWGEGVIMPGEFVDTDLELGPPWTIDEEADQAVQAAAGTPAPVEEPPPAEAPAEPPVEGPPVHTLPNGDVVTDAGAVVGHIDTPDTAE